MASRQGFGELKTEQLGGHSQEQQRHRQAPIDDDDNHLTTFTDAVFPRRLNTVDFWPLMRHSFWLSAFLDIVTSILHLLTSKLLHNLVDMATFPSTLGLPGFCSTEQSSMELPLHGEKANVSGNERFPCGLSDPGSEKSITHNSFILAVYKEPLKSEP